jgi:hypothetical protein
MTGEISARVPLASDAKVRAAVDAKAAQPTSKFEIERTRYVARSSDH